MTNPIFIIGTERSGTNLLRLILNTHSNIAIPHPPHIMKNFKRLEPLYGDLKDTINFRNLIKDILNTVRLHPCSWDIDINLDSVLERAYDRNLISIFFSLYEQYLRSTGKRRWGCKSTFMLYHVKEILDYFSRAKFIYMVRDGRDVAASAKNSIFNYYNVCFVANLWKKEQNIGIKWLNNLCEDNICLVRYEDLLEEPRRIVEKICLFLEEELQPNMFNFFKTEEARKSANISFSWKNTATPIIKDNKNKFFKNLSVKEIQLFERIAGRELEYFAYKVGQNYSKGANFNFKENKMFVFSCLVQEVLNIIRVQIKHFFYDRNNILRYKKFFFLKNIYFRRKLL